VTKRTSRAPEGTSGNPKQLYISYIKGRKLPRKKRYVTIDVLLRGGFARHRYAMRGCRPAADAPHPRYVHASRALAIVNIVDVAR
jgi:hypothetical protein